MKFRLDYSPIGRTLFETVLPWGRNVKVNVPSIQMRAGGSAFCFGVGDHGTADPPRRNNGSFTSAKQRGGARMTVLRSVTVFIAATILGGSMTGTAPNQAHSSQNGNLALVGGTIYLSPSEEPLREGVVLIQGDKIAAVGPRSSVKLPANTPVVDCSGLTITAGFWNSHVHFMERKWANVASVPAPELDQQLQDMLTRYGFTTAFDLSSPWENTRLLRDRIESGEVRGPRIYSTGSGLLPANPGIPEAAIAFMGWTKSTQLEISDAAQAAAASKQLLDAGVDGIKLFASAPSKAALSQDTMAAAVNAAHRLGKPVFVHPNSGTDVLTAVRAGVDVIAHTTPYSGPWDESLLTAMSEHRVALIPTLWIWKWYSRHDRRSVQDKIVKTETGQLHAWVATGGTVLFGTDLGAVDPDPSEEYVLMSEAGMSFRQILASLTTAPAGRFGESKRVGRIAPGLQADLVVLKEDPAKEIRTLTKVQYTMRAGKIIYRSGE